MYCLAKNCRSKFRDNPSTLSFHSFPSDEHQKSVWKERLQIEGHILKSNRVCNLHLEEEDFYLQKHGKKLKKFLKKGAVPKIKHFNYEELANSASGSANADPSSKFNTMITEDSADFLTQTSYEELANSASGSTNADLSSKFDSMTTDCEMMLCDDGDSDNTTLDALSDEYVSWDPSHFVLDGPCAPCPEKKDGADTMEHKRSYNQSEALQIDIERLQKRIRALETKNRTLTRNIQRKHKQVIRQKSEIQKLRAIIRKSNKRANDISKEDLNSLPPAMKCLFQRMVARNKKKGKRYTVPYNEDLKRFVVQMDFMSPKCYRFFRSECDNAVPSCRTIARWYQNLQCDPGFTGEALQTLKALVESEQAAGRAVVCQMVFDEISIFSQFQKVGDREYGMAQFGALKKADGNPALATQLLVFMVVSIDQKWKIPIGYFPFWSMTAEQKADIIVKAVYRAEEAGVKVLGLTFDGAPINLAVMQLLGADMRKSCSIAESYRCVISDDEAQVHHELYLFPDPCHMVKLVRNTLGEYDLVDKENRDINFKFVVELFELQRSGFLTGLDLGTKLKNFHILFQNKKMNVELAVQVLSRSVAEALDFCRDVLVLPQFAASQGTSHFIRMMNDIFDVLNSRNDAHLGFKSPLSDANICEREIFCNEAAEYISELKIRKKNGCQRIIDSANKMGFIGIIICLKNLPHMYREVKQDLTGGMKTYMLNQDHIELFFGSIRTRLGANTNPSVLQFRSAYKRLLTYVQLEKRLDGTNCLASLDDIVVLKVNTSRSLDYINNDVKPNNSRHTFYTEEEVDQEFAEDESDDFLQHSSEELNHETQLALQFSVRQLITKMVKKVSCELCCSALTQNSGDPSDFILNVTELCEIFIRKTIEKDRSSFLTTFKVSVMLNSILKELKDNAFEHNLYHFLENVDHYINLITIYVTKYANIRIRKQLQIFNEKDSIRNKLRCLTHFKNM